MAMTASSLYLPTITDHLDAHRNLTNHPEYVPDIVEFVTSPHFLNRPNLYPRQATYLKVIFLELEMFTQYDYDVIGEWIQGFKLPERPPAHLDPESEAVLKYEGDWGIVPDVLDRIEILRSLGYRWFRQILSVLGRRSGKGYIGGLAGAYVLWYYLMLGDAREHFGIDRDKRLACQVFAGKKGQARDNQWRDIVNVMAGAPCFQKYISQSLAESLTVNSKIDLIRPARDTTMDLATYEIVPKEATTMAARGPASFMQFYDEMAHMVSTTGGSRSAEEVYDSATPSLDQFKRLAFIYSGSSPWQMTGKFYELASQTLQVDADTRKPVYPENLLLQLESWNIYEDWDRTGDGKMVARPKCTKIIPFDGPKEFPEITFKPLKNAIQEYDERMQRLERANPDTFRVERRSKWATVMDAYFPEMHVRRMFAPWTQFPGEEEPQRLAMKHRGSPTIDYIGHADPGKTGSNFGFAIGHKVFVKGQELPHVVFDVIKAWTPQDFPTGEMDYEVIEEEMKEYVDNFMPTQLTFDQWNSIGFIQRIGAHSRKNNYKVTKTYERTATAPINWKTAETMKVALSLNLIHCPIYDLLELECLFLRKLNGDKVDHPDSGPVTTKDVYDAVSIVIHELIGADVAAYLGEQLSDLKAVTGLPGPRSPEGSRDVHNQFSAFTAERREAMRRGSPARPITTRGRTPGRRR